MPKNVKMADPKKVYNSPQGGLVVQGNAIVQFPDPVHGDVMLKIAKGYLIETDEEPRANSYHWDVSPTASTVPRWVTNPPKGQKIIKAPEGPSALPATLTAQEAASMQQAGVPAEVIQQISDLHVRVSQLEAQVAGASSAGAASQGEGNGSQASGEDLADLEQALADAGKNQEKALASARKAIAAAEKKADAAKSDSAKEKAETELAAARQELEELEQMHDKKVSEASAALDAAKSAGTADNTGGAQ
jgi:hypothetical protein